MAAESAGDQWRSLRNDLERSFAQGKNSLQAVFELSMAYGRLDEAEQNEVNGVLIEWVLSEDECLRYDALYLVKEHQVHQAVPALRALQDRLENDPSRPGAPYEWAKINGLLGRLTSG
jgi:hypothetical protein